jgi:hypothetical protein
MVEVFGARTTAALNKTTTALNDTQVQTSLISGALSAVTAYMVSGATTKTQIKAVFDDIIDMSLFTPLSTAITAVMPNAAIQGSVIVTSALAGLGVGEKITDAVLTDDMFDSDGKLKEAHKMKVALIAGAVGAGCVYVTPYIKDILAGKDIGFSVGDKLDDADKVTAILLKLIAAYVIGGIAYAVYGRFKVADANEDGKCTAVEYESWLNGLDGIGGIFKPVITFMKPVLSAVPGFDEVA